MFHRILVPLDGSILAEQALGIASTIAARAGGAVHRLDLVLVDSKHPHGTGAGDTPERVYVNGIAEEAGRLLGVSCTASVVEGDPAPMIVQRAAEIEADLIVMTTHGRTGLSRALLGSVADRVVREAGRPVLVQRPTSGRQWRSAVSAGFHRVLIPLDGTDEAMKVIAPALDLCRWMEARPVLVRVVLPIVSMTFSDAGVPAYGTVDEDATRLVVSEAQDALTDLALDIEADRHIRVETAVAVGGDVGKTLVEVARARSVDLIAMVTHAHGAGRLLLGSVADHLLHDLPLPLLLLHAPVPAVAGAVAAHEPRTATR